MKRFLFLLIILFINLLTVTGQINTNNFLDSAMVKNDKKKDYLAALRALNMIIRFNVDFDSAYYFRALIKYNLKDYRGSIEDCSKAINIRPNSSNYFVSRGKARERLFDYKGAMNDYNEAKLINPSNPDVYLSRGLLFLNKKNFDDGIKDFNKLIEIDPFNSFGYLYKGLGKELKGLYKDALTDFNKAILLDSISNKTTKYLDYYAELGIFMQMLEKLNPESFALNKLNPETYARRGRDYFDMKEYKSAIKDFDRAIEIDSEFSYAYFNRGLAKISSSDLQGALKDYSTVIRLDHDNAIAYYCRATLKDSLCDYNGAIDDYNQVARINPNNVFNYFNRAITWQHLHQFRKAINDYSKAISLNPEFAIAYHNRSIARKEINDLQGAENDFKTEAKLQELHNDPNHKNIIDSTRLARLTDFKGDFEEGNVLNNNINEEGIYPFPIFTISYITKDTLNQNPMIVNSKIQSLNKNYAMHGSFIITSGDDTIPQAVAVNEIDSINSIPGINEKKLPLFERAILKNNIQDYNGSLDDYELLLKIDQNFSVGYFNRANTRYNMISFLKLFTDVSNNAITIGNTNSQAQQSRKKIIQNYDDIVADYLKCIRLDPDFYYAYYNMALVDIINRNYKDAISYFNQAIIIEPKFAEGYYNRGLTYIFMQQNEEGCRDMSKAGELGVQRAYNVIKKYCNE